MINDYVLDDEGMNGGQALASASGVLVSIEQVVDLYQAASGNIISIEQIVRGKASGAIISFQQLVL